MCDESGGFEGLGGEEESCGCMCIEFENMSLDTSNILGTLRLLISIHVSH